MNTRFQRIYSVSKPLPVIFFLALVAVTPASAASHMKDKGDPKSAPAGSMERPAMHVEKDASSMKSNMESMTGNADYDFAVNMRTHHQMALDMSNAELKNGKDPQMQRMAKNIIAAQKKEIAAFDKWIARHPEGSNTATPGTR